MTSMVGLLIEFKAKSESVDAQFAKINTQIEQLQTRANKTSDVFGNLGGTIKTAFAGISIGYIAAQLWDIVKASGALYDETQKLGITVANYQALSQVSKEAGVSQESLSTALSKLKVTIGDANLGSKTAADSLKLLGLTANDFKGKDLGAEFALVSSRLRMINDDNLRAAIGMQYFGRSAKDIMGLVKTDVEGSVDAFKALNSTLTQTQSANLDNLTDSIDRLWNVSKGRVAKVLADAVPTIEALASKLSSISTSVSDILLNGVTEWIRGIREGIEVAKPFLDKMFNSNASGLEKILEAINRATGGGLNSLSDQGNDFLVGKNGLFSSSSSTAASDVGSHESSAKKIAGNASSAAVSLSLDGFIRSQMIMKNAGDSAAKALTDLVASAKKLTAVQDALNVQGKKQSKDILAQAALDTQRPLADSTQFQKIVDQLIKSQTRGSNLLGVDNQVGAGGSAVNQIASGLKSLQDIINSKSGSFDTSGLKETLNELTAYLQNKSVGDQQAAKVDLNVTVSPSPDFITKTTSNVVHSPQLTEAVKQQWYTEWGNIARGAGIRGR